MVKEHNTENYKRLVERLQAACNSITKALKKYYKAFVIFCITLSYTAILHIPP